MSQSSVLVGMEEIKKYYPRGRKLILRLIKEEGFPAKLVNGTYESDKALIDEWRRSQIMRGGCQ